MRKIKYTNPVSGASITFGESTDTYQYILESVDGVDIPKTDHQIQKAPFQDGSTLIDSLYGEREIEIMGHLNAGQDLPTIYAARKAAAVILNPKDGPGTIEYTNDEGTFYATGIPDGGPMFKNKIWTEPMQPYKIRFICADPYWYGAEQTLTAPFEGDAGFFVYNFAPASGPGDLAPVQYPTPFTAILQGPFTYCVISYYGMYLGIEASCTSSEIITVNTEFGKKSVIKTSGGVNTNIMSAVADTHLPAGVTSSFFKITPVPYPDAGIMQFYIGTTGYTIGVTGFTFKFKERWAGL